MLLDKQYAVKYDTSKVFMEYSTEATIKPFMMDINSVHCLFRHYLLWFSFLADI